MAFLTHQCRVLAVSILLLNTLTRAQGVGEPIPEYNPTFTTAPISIFPTTTEPLFSTSTVSDPPSYSAPTCPLPDNSPYTNSVGDFYTIRCPASWSTDLESTAGVTSLDACLVLCTDYGVDCGAAVWDQPAGNCSLKYGQDGGGEILPGNEVVGVRIVQVQTSTTSAESVVTDVAPIYPVPAPATANTTASSVIVDPVYSDPSTTSSSAVAPPAYSDPAPPAYNPPPGACTYDTPTGSQSSLTGLEYTLSCNSRCVGGVPYDTSTVSNGFVDCFALCDYESGCGGFTFTGQDDQGGAGVGTCELISAPDEPAALYFVPAGRGTVGGVRGEAVLVGGPTTTPLAPLPTTGASGVATVFVTPVESPSEYETVIVTLVESPTGGETVIVTPVPGTPASDSSTTEESSVMIVVPFPATTPSISMTDTGIGGGTVVIDMPTPVTPSAPPSSASVAIVTPIPAITPSSSTTGGPTSMNLSSYFDPAASTTGVCLPRPCSVCTKVTTVIAVSATPAMGAYIVGGLMG